ncbi:hypothetical protein [Yoonia sp. BS5-3]|uniref:Lipoprotein n=1 Tax=Yoonia phaeophyticola TaxID=3137369 RepID=A0ABZ2V739_9RHOB
MKKFFLIIALGALAACGADGDPLQPNANVGLSIGAGGISPNASVGASNGNVSLGLNL